MAAPSSPPSLASALEAAARQLETAVQEQEQAVIRILGLAERMADSRDRVTQLQADGVMEACSFQDLTGQRIRKVIRLLRVLSGVGEGAALAAATPPPPEKSGLSQEDVDRLLAGKPPSK